jgi:hypothetical protein
MVHFQTSISWTTIKSCKIPISLGYNMKNLSEFTLNLKLTL